MQPRYYIGLDVHKKKISYCVRDGGGKVHAAGCIPATRFDLDLWVKRLPRIHPTNQGSPRARIVARFSRAGFECFQPIAARNPNESVLRRIFLSTRP
jgi:hypothetical protein